MTAVPESFQPPQSVLTREPFQPVVGDAIRELLRHRLLVAVGALVQVDFDDAAEDRQPFVAERSSAASRGDWTSIERLAAEPLDLGQQRPVRGVLAPRPAPDRGRSFQCRGAPARSVKFASQRCQLCSCAAAANLPSSSFSVGRDLGDLCAASRRPGAASAARRSDSATTGIGLPGWPAKPLTPTFAWNTPGRVAGRAEDLVVVRGRRKRCC